MKPYATSDFETDPFRAGRIPQVFAAGFHDGTRTALFWGNDCLKQWWAMAQKFDGLIYFHNGGQFDFHYLFVHLPMADCKIQIQGERIVKIETPYGCELRDSFAIVPRSLAAWEKAEISYRVFEPELREANKDKIMRYLGSDLINSREMLTAFFQRHPRQNLTLAGATFSALRKATPLQIPSTGKWFDEQHRPYLFGGRCQFYALGQIQCPVHVLDINSAYPAAMLRPHWSGKYSTIYGRPPAANMEQSLLDVTCQAAGCFPLRIGTEVLFPHGKNRFLVTGWEFVAAQELGLVSDVTFHSIETPDETQSFGEFVEPLYRSKQQAPTEEEKFFAKLELNALWGKFGIQPERQQVIQITKYGKLLRAPWRLRYDDLDRGLTVWSRPAHTGRTKEEALAAGDQPDPILRYNNVATAASISGQVRAVLLRGLAQSVSPLYCDTDSLFVNDDALEMFERGTGLGQWRHDFTFEKLWIGGKKLYVGWGYDPAITPRKYEWKTASKNIRLSAGKLRQICSGRSVRQVQAAPTFSLFNAPTFTGRRIARAREAQISVNS